MTSAPLTYVSSGTSMSRTVSATLPQEVVSCLKNARFLHLATCTHNIPHISLMNYTYLPSTPFPSHASPTIIMTTNPSSRKTANLLSNPNVSLLVHDWVSHRPAPANPGGGAGGREGSPPPAAQGSSLAALLLGLNTAALGRISATINGVASVPALGEEEEVWCRAQHVENHRFGDEGANGAGAAGEARAEDGGTECFVEGEGVTVVVVRITGGRIADWKGGVRDFVVGDEEEGMVNGVV